MINQSRLARSLWCAFAVFALLAAPLQCVATAVDYGTLNEYEVTAGAHIISRNYFHREAILPTIALCFSLLSIVCALVATLLTAPSHLSRTPFSARKTYVPTSIGFVFSAVLLALYPYLESLPLRPLTALTCVLLLLAALYALLSGFPRLRNRTSLSVPLGFAAILSSMLLNAYCYFDTTLEMNAPVKVSLQVALLFLTLSYTAELRYLLGSEQPRLYLILSATAVAFGYLAAPSAIFAFYLEKLQRLDYLGIAVLVLLFACTQTVRLWRLLKGENIIGEACDVQSNGSNTEISNGKGSPAPSAEEEE